MTPSPIHKPWLLIFLSLVLAGCPALPILIPPLVQFGASMLNSAIKNYDEPHQQNMESLLTALQQPTNPFIAQGITANPNDQMGDQYSSEYPNQDYQTGQDYPPSQDYSQQGYDPYQNAQPDYEGNPQYPNDPDSNHFPQGDDPYANHSGFPNQQTPPTGYPPQPGQPQYSQYEQSHQNPYEESKVPISLDVLLVKKHLVNGVKSYLPIKDGDVLFDGRGNPQAGDKFRVMFRANTNCYVYVIAVDGTAWAQGIFPPTSNPFANPVKAGEQHLLPEGNNWFSLDQFKGIETIFFVASHERRPDIEDILTTISGRERHPSERPVAVSEPAIIPNGFSGARPGASPFAFTTSQRTQQKLLPTTYFVKTAGEDLRLTRWFRHQ